MREYPFIQCNACVLASAIRQENEIGMQIKKKEMKLPLFTDDMIIYIETSQGIYKRALRINKVFTKAEK